MDCDRIRDDLGRREAGLLDPGAILDLERHLAGCDACRIYSRKMKTLVGLLEEFPEVRTLPRPSALRRLSHGRVAVVAAALLMALAVPLVGCRLGVGVVPHLVRPCLELRVVGDPALQGDRLVLGPAR